MPLDKERKCIYIANADIKCEYGKCERCPHYPDKANEIECEDEHDKTLEYLECKTLHEEGMWC